MNPTRHFVALSIAMAAAFGLCACGGGAEGSSGSVAGGPEPTPAGAPAPAPRPFGTGCAAVPSTGSGSFEGMASDPVATAASHNPALSMLSDAIKKAKLFDTLNNAQNITVFAPANAAFEQLATATRDRVFADDATLAKILTYHVVSRRIAPSELGAGNFPSLEGATLSTSGSGEDFKINGTASVICGNVQTANATVYIVDDLLKPPGN